MFVNISVCNLKHCTGIRFWECSYNNAGYRILLLTAPSVGVMVLGYHTACYHNLEDFFLFGIRILHLNFSTPCM